MTAEIAVLNKSAVALAADSAVTITSPAGDKIYNSVNKLFMLSEYHPVGIMIYGDAEIMDVPWEPVIKVYRKTLADKALPTLRDYADHFVKFVSSATNIFSADVQRHAVRMRSAGVFAAIRSQIDDAVKVTLEKEKSVSEKAIRQIVKSAIAQEQKIFEGKKRLPSIPAKHENRVLSVYKEVFEKVLAGVFQKLPIAAASKNALMKMAARYFCCDRFMTSHTGVVIAGYGSDEIFPSVIHLQTDVVAAGVLKYKKNIESKISLTQTSLIIPFAQVDMVSTFMEGIDPFYERFLNGVLSEIFKRFPEDVVAKVKEMTPLGAGDGQGLIDSLRAVGTIFTSDIDDRLKSFKKSRHTDPITMAASLLPKEDLASMAESLINLTSLKRRISMDAETVGGPIDVAVISKGDGFIWIKRKHYFEPKLNPHFMAGIRSSREPKKD